MKDKESLGIVPTRYRPVSVSQDESTTGTARVSSSGCEILSFQSEHLEVFSGHFNKPEISDVTFQVGDSKYYTHRFVLAAHSSVFRTMLMGDGWKESQDSVVKLEEPEECKEVFANFLKFLYTGKLTITCEAVCAYHMLADKYDITRVKGKCEAFIGDVLKGEHGDALWAALEWLQYVDAHLTDLLPVCYQALRTNFHGLHRSDIKLQAISQKHMVEIFANGDDITVPSEFSVYQVLEKWINLKAAENSSESTVTSHLEKLLPHIRFGNMDVSELQAVKESGLWRKYGNTRMKYLTDAYQVQAELLSFAIKAHKFPAAEIFHLCPSGESSCPHKRPRLYYDSPFGMTVKCLHWKKVADCVQPAKISGFSSPPIQAQRFSFGSVKSPSIRKPATATNKPNGVAIKIVDLETLHTYSRPIIGADYPQSDNWYFKWKDSKDDDIIVEKFAITPSASHNGRKYSLIIILGGEEENQTYSVKKTGFASSQKIALTSPRRSLGTWRPGENSQFHVTVYLQPAPAVAAVPVE